MICLIKSTSHTARMFTSRNAWTRREHEQSGTCILVFKGCTIDSISRIWFTSPVAPPSYLEVQVRLCAVQSAA